MPCLTSGSGGLVYPTPAPPGCPRPYIMPSPCPGHWDPEGSPSQTLPSFRPLCPPASALPLPPHAPGASERSAWPHRPALRLRTPAHMPAPGPPDAPSGRAGGGPTLPSPLRADRVQLIAELTDTGGKRSSQLRSRQGPGIQEWEEGQPRAASLPGPNRTAAQQQWPCAPFLPLLKYAARRSLERACFPGRTGQTRQGGV